MDSVKPVGLVISQEDNVATVFGEVEAGESIDVVDRKGSKSQLVIRDKIPYGHKIAVRKIACGEAVTKYGESIGLASTDITEGQHVHVHNVESGRARGDWSKEVEA